MLWRQRLIWLVLGFVLAWALVLIWRQVRAPGEPAAAGSAGPQAQARLPSARGTVPVRSPECYLGVVVAREAVDVATEAAGHLERIEVRIGDRVAQGDVVALLDTQAVDYQLAIERANLRSAEAQQRRQALEADRSAQEHHRRLALEGLLSREEEEAAAFRHQTAAVALEEAAAEVARVEARIAELEGTLERSRMRAPFAATVARRYLDAGARVAAGTPVVRLISSGNLLVRFAVPPEGASAVAVGAAVRVEVEEPALTLGGVVEQLSPEIDAGSQMLFVEARLEAKAGAAAAVPSGAAARVSRAAAGTAASCRGGR